MLRFEFLKVHIVTDGYQVGAHSVDLDYTVDNSRLNTPWLATEIHRSCAAFIRTIVLTHLLQYFVDTAP